jgi:hypothetical protein
MNSDYKEMSGVASMPGSLNKIIVEIHRFKRPPSLSESFAWTPDNIERAERTSTLRDSTFSLIALDEKQISPTATPVGEAQRSSSSVVSISEDTYEFFIINLILRFLFHIVLISIFETVFFFIYVSTLEDNGIIKTVNALTGNIVNSCKNLTAIEVDIVDFFLEPFLNATTTAQQASQTLATRTLYNNSLFRNAWLYVGGFSVLFLIGVAYATCRKIRIRWRTLVFENIGLVVMLALYEYMFFSTVIFLFTPISGQEIANNFVMELQDTCHLLNETR